MDIDDNYLTKEVYKLREEDKLEFSDIAHKLDISNRETRNYYSRAKGRIAKFGLIKDIKPKLYYYEKRNYKKICVVCKKEFETNLSKKKTCSDECKDIRHNKISKIKSAEWYRRHKKRQNENTKRDYLKNTNRWKERKFVGNHREEFIKILGEKCRLCDSKEDIEFHHLRYSNLLREIIEYSKYLIPVCKSCHKKVEIII